MKTIGQMMDAFKSITTVEYIRGVKTMAWPPFNGKLWQRNYYEHIIRNRQSYQNISRFIINNPAKWRDDDFFLTRNSIGIAAVPEGSGWLRHQSQESS